MTFYGATEPADHTKRHLVDAALLTIHPYSPGEAALWDNPIELNAALEGQACPGCGILMYLIATMVRDALQQVKLPILVQLVLSAAPFYHPIGAQRRRPRSQAVVHVL